MARKAAADARRWYLCEDNVPRRAADLRGRNPRYECVDGDETWTPIEDQKPCPPTNGDPSAASAATRPGG